MKATSLVVFASLLALAVGEVAFTTHCDGVNKTQCSVDEVRIVPCKPKDLAKHFCTLTKTKDAHMEFEFTPNFETSNLKTGVYWPTATGDLPFAGLTSDDACLLTTCPTVAGQQQTLVYDLHLGSKLPTGRFQFKWKVWNADNANDTCCFRTTIKLKK